MSRQELADAVNAHVYATTNRVSALNAHYISRLERGGRRWPNADYRAGFRAVLGAETDAALGFVCNRDTTGTTAHETSTAPVSATQEAAPTHLVMAHSPTIVVVPGTHPVVVALVDKPALLLAVGALALVDATVAPPHIPALVCRPTPFQYPTYSGSVQMRSSPTASTSPPMPGSKPAPL